MNHDFGAVPFPLEAALTLGNNSRSAAAVAINLHRIYKPLKCRSPFLLAAPARRTVGGTSLPPRETKGRRERGSERESIKNRKVSPQLFGAALFANSSARGEAAIDQELSPLRSTGGKTHILFVHSN